MNAMLSLSQNFLVLPTFSRLKRPFASVSNGWSYVSPSLRLTRHLINLTLQSGVKMSKRVNTTLKGAVPRLKLWSIVGVPGALKSIPPRIQKIWQSVQWKDHQGALFGVMAVSLIVGDAFDSITTFVNATLETLHLAKVAWISKIALPFGLGLVSLVLASKSIRLYTVAAFSRAFSRDVMDKINNKSLSSKDLIELLNPFIQTHLPENQKDWLNKEQTTANMAILERHSTPEIATHLKNVAVILKDKAALSEEQKSEVIKRLQTIEKLLKKEMTLQPLSLTATTISFVALTLFLQPALPALPFAMLAVSTVMQIGLQMKQEEGTSKEETPSLKKEIL